MAVTSLAAAVAPRIGKIIKNGLKLYNAVLCVRQESRSKEFTQTKNRLF